MKCYQIDSDYFHFYSNAAGGGRGGGEGQRVPFNSLGPDKSMFSCYFNLPPLVIVKNRYSLLQHMQNIADL